MRDGCRGRRREEGEEEELLARMEDTSQEIDANLERRVEQK